MAGHWRTVLLAGTLLGWGGAAHAQSQGQVPTREEVNPPVPDRRDNTSTVEVDSSQAFARGPCPLDSSDLRTTIPDVQFSGIAGAPLAPELVPLLSGIEAPAGEQPVRVVCDIRDQANAALRRARYVATVQIPAQRLDGGPLKLEVVTAHIVETRVRGDAGPYERLIESRIATLQSLDPLNEAEAERLLLLADDIPGLDVRLALQPAGGAPGEVIGELTVDYHRFAVIANVQNYNSRQLGRETAYARAELFGLTGLGDLTYIAGSFTPIDFDEQKIVQAGHEMLLAQNGTTLALRATYADSRPDLPTLELRTKSYILNAEVTQPLLRSLPGNFYATLGFERIDQRTKLGGVGGSSPLNLDRISTAYTRFSGNARALQPDGTERTAFGGFVEFRQGLDLFEATKTGQFVGGYAPSRFEGNAKATVIRGQFDAKIGWGPIFELAGEVRGQWTHDPLLNYDEFSIGNLTVGRGYDPGAATGDKAYSTSVELRANLPTGPKFGTQIYGFYDGIRLWNLDTGTTEADRRLESIGAGVRFTLPGAARLDLTYAHPMDPPLLTGTGNKVPKDRFLVSLTAQLVPFSFGR
ncbi:MAG TPA: ShlB/FhaC/HecB family hemolysin secretion/activation protein [Novosphingobium sp.]|nr:ShlB/FhaC/HecB family hemolysin secretion/activation protein [Novosphingobium sp.]